MTSYPELTAAAELRPIGIDDLSSVRYVHTAAFRSGSGSRHSEEEVAAFTALVYRSAYGDQMLAEHLYGAWIERELVATSGWCPADDSGATARITSLFVRPLFLDGGLGTLLLRHAESRARQAGFEDFSVRSSLACIGFYERFRYEITSYGVRSLGAGVDLRIAFMRRCSRNAADGEHHASACPALARGGVDVLEN